MPGLAGVARVAQREIHLVDRAPPRRRADAARRDRRSRPPRHVHRHGCPAAARHVRVRRGREQCEKRFDDGVVPGEAVAARPVERGHADLERDLERRGVLPRDPVAVGGEPHHVEQRHRRLVGDVLRLRASQSAWRRTANRRVHVARVLDAGRLEHPAQFVSKARRRSLLRHPIARDQRLVKRRLQERRACKRSQEEDDAEIRVRGRPARGRLDGEAHRRAERTRGRAADRPANRGRAREEVFVARVGEGASRRDVARLRRARLEEAGELRGDRDVCRPERTRRDRRDERRLRDLATRVADRHAGSSAVDLTVDTRPTRCSTIAPATSSPVACCSPRHPGIPFTSSTNTVPSRDGSRSTPA